MDKYSGNPFYSGFSKKSILSFSPSRTYNCKTKIYTDGTINSTISRTNVFANDDYLNHRENFFQQHSLDLEHGQNILDVLSGKSHADLIVENQFRYDMGWISSNECVEKNQELRALTRSLDKYSFYDDDFDYSHSCTSDGVRHDSLKRAKDKVFDYIMSNEFDWFFTGTINPKKMDSLNPKDCLKPLTKWFNNMQQRYDISYIVIFELHPKSGRIHLHGLIKENPDKPLKLELSKTRQFYGFCKPMKKRTATKYCLNWDSGRPIYNLKTWKFGFSTAIHTYGNRAQIAHYVTKYITKDCKKIFGKFFWHSRDLDKPRVIFSNVDYDSLQVPEYHGYKFSYQSPYDTKK